MSDVQTTQRLAGQYLTGAGSDLLLASTTSLSAEDRLMYATRAWSSWASACAAMAELEHLMPRSVQAGYDRHAKIVEHGTAREPKKATK